MSDTLTTLRSKAGDYPKKFNLREARLSKIVSDGLGAVRVVAAGRATTVGGAATEDITIAGVLATDQVLATMRVRGAAPVTILAAVTAADKITLTFSANPAADHSISYLILRAL